MPASTEPNHGLNFKVPELTDEEAVVACYMQLEAKIVNGGKIFVAGNWLPSCKLFKNENFLAAMGLCPAFPKGNSTEGVRLTLCLCFICLLLTIKIFRRIFARLHKRDRPGNGGATDFYCFEGGSN